MRITRTELALRIAGVLWMSALVVGAVLIGLIHIETIRINQALGL